MSTERSSSIAEGEVPSWASPMSQGREDGLRSSESRKSLECTSVTISIPKTEYIRSTSSGGHQVYIMNISSGSKSWQIPRRYSDFHYLDVQLGKYMLRKDIPPFPPKRFIGSSTDRKFVEDRRMDLERYISSLVVCAAAWNVSDFVRFIDNEEGSMMMLWNLEKMRRVQDTLSTMTLHNRSQTAKLTADLTRANEQVAMLQERIARMEMLLLQQVTGAVPDAAFVGVLRNATRDAEGGRDPGQPDGPLSPLVAAAATISPEDQRWEGGGHEADAIVQEAIGCWSRPLRPSSPQMAQEQVLQVLDMTATAVSAGRMRSLSAGLNVRDEGSAMTDEGRMTRKSFPRSASASLQNKSASVEEVRAMAVSIQLQEAVELSNHVLEEQYDMQPVGAHADSTSAIPTAAAFETGVEDTVVCTGDIGLAIGVPACSEALVSQIDQIVRALLPTRRDIETRQSVLQYLQGVVSSTLGGAECFAIGSHISNTYLPNGDIDVTIILANDGSVKGASAGAGADAPDPWYVRLNEALCMISMGKCHYPAVPSGAYAGPGAAGTNKMVVSNVSFVNAEVKIVKSQINGVNIDITSNRISAMYAQAMVELLDEFVGKNHLLKRSLLLIKAWIINEAPRHSAGGGSIAGAQNGGMKSWCFAVMTIWIFNHFGSGIQHPVHALAVFLSYYSTFPWTKYAVTVAGPVMSEGLLPLADGDPNKPTTSGLFSSELLTEYQRRYEYTRACSEGAAKGEDTTTPYAPFVSTIATDRAPTESVLESSGCAAPDGAPTTTGPTYLKPAKASQPTPWLAAAAFGGDSAENYRRGIVSVVDPVQVKNNLSKAVTISSFHTMVAVFQKGHIAIRELLSQSSAANSASTEALVREFMLNTTSQLSGLGRARGFSEVGLDLDFYSTVLTSKTTEVERSVRHAEFILGSVVHYDELMKTICMLLEQRGAPLPVGEIGKLLQERLGCAAISSRVKLDCGGLKKAIEVHGTQLLGLSSDHPYNPSLYLLAAAPTHSSADCMTMSGSLVSGKTSRSGSDVGSLGSQGSFLPLSRGGSFKEQKHHNHQGGGLAQSPKRQYQNYGGSSPAAGSYGHHQYGHHQGQVRSRGNSNLSDHSNYYYGNSPGGVGAGRNAPSYHAVPDPHQHYHNHNQGFPQPPVLSHTLPVGVSPPRYHPQHLHLRQNPFPGDGLASGAAASPQHPSS